MGGGKPTGRGPAPRAAIVGQPKRARLPRGRNSFLHTSLRAIGESRWTAVAASVFSRSRLWIAYRGQGFHSIFFAAREGGPLPSNSCNEPCSGNNPLRGGGGIPIQGEQPATKLVNGNTAWNLDAQGQPVAQPANVAGDRQLMIRANPIGFIKEGLEASNAAATDRYFGRENRTVKVVAFTTKVCDGPQPQCTRRLTGEFNNDNMLERVITWVPDPVLGDKMVETRYSDYRDVGGGVKFPFRLHAHMGDHPLIPGGHNWLDLRASDVKVNVADAAQAVPDSVRNAAAPQVQVVKTQLAPGVVLMGGGSHNSVAVEFKDFVMVIEG